MGMSQFGAGGGQSKEGDAEIGPEVLKALGHRARPGVHEQAQLHGLWFLLFCLEAAENRNSTG